MGARPETLAGVSGTGDIMLTCFVNLSRNRTVGVRLGSGETLEEVLGSMNQVAEGCRDGGCRRTISEEIPSALARAHRGGEHLGRAHGRENGG